MSTRQILVVNHSQGVSARDVALMSKAIDLQISRDVAPFCGIFPVKCSAQKFTQVMATVHIFQHADQADALGYHAEDPQGNVYGRVFTDDAIQNGASVCSVLSHEVLEILGDANINMWALSGDEQTFYAKELCDPVEGSGYGVRVEGTVQEVSNFVLPAWFDAQAASDSKFDYLGHLSAPFTLEQGGYAVILAGGTVSQIFGQKYPEWRKNMKKFAGSRTSRRLSGKAKS